MNVGVEEVNGTACCLAIALRPRDAHKMTRDEKEARACGSNHHAMTRGGTHNTEMRIRCFWSESVRNTDGAVTHGTHPRTAARPNDDAHGDLVTHLVALWGVGDEATRSAPSRSCR